MATPPVKLDITPETRIGQLLDAYPELEGVLIGLAPPFAKLKNPILRRTVARVTSLSQAARVGGVSLGELIGALRRAAGQPEYAVAEVATMGVAAESAGIKVIRTLDARPLIERGEHPMGMVLGALDDLGDGEAFELITPFEPAPLIDKARGRGFRSSTIQHGVDEYVTRFWRG